jgi:hypothetical protein
MKNFKLLLHLTLLAFALLLSACASNFKPAPIGDELIWSSHSKRPGWTVKSPDVDQGNAYVFVGQSLYHSTERAARTNAEVNAATQASTYLLQEVSRTYNQETAGSAAESQVMNNQVKVLETVTLTSDQVLAKMAIDDLYIEQWRKGKETLWKVFAKAQLPKSSRN